jgi:hypothetical protein
MTKTYTPGITGDEHDRHLTNYQKAISDMQPLPRPEEFERILKSLSKEPSPPDIFNETVKERLRNLWYTARVSRERYLSQLANEMLMAMPRIVDERGRAIADKALERRC